MGVADRVFELVAAEILNGLLRPNELISERALVTKYGVSRTPVREALKRLQERGLLTTGPKGTSVVKASSLDELRQLYALRIRLERAAAILTVREIAPEEINRLSEINGRFSKAVQGRDLNAMLKIRAEFHEVSVRATRNPWFAEVLIDLREKSYVVRHWHWQEFSRAQEAVRLHDALIAALVRRDARTYRELVDEQIRAPLDAFSQRLIAQPPSAPRDRDGEARIPGARSRHT